MNTKYHLKRRNYVYGNRQLWFEEPNHLIEIFDDKNAAEEMLSRYNLSSYTDKHIYQFISTMDDRKVILERLEEFLRLEFDISMRMPNSSSYEINFQLPAMSKEQYQKVHDIIGITWCVIEEVKPTGLFVIRDCFGYYMLDENESHWLEGKEFTTYQEAEDVVMHCIASAFLFRPSDSDNPPFSLRGTIEELATDTKSLKTFLSQSKYFLFKEGNWEYAKGVHIRKPVKRIKKTIKGYYDFSENVNDDVNDFVIDLFEPELLAECKELTKLLRPLYSDIVEI